MCQYFFFNLILSIVCHLWCRSGHNLYHLTLANALVWLAVCHQTTKPGRMNKLFFLQSVKFPTFCFLNQLYALCNVCNMVLHTFVCACPEKWIDSSFVCRPTAVLLCAYHKCKKTARIWLLALLGHVVTFLCDMNSRPGFSAATW